MIDWKSYKNNFIITITSLEFVEKKSEENIDKIRKKLVLKDLVSYKEKGVYPHRKNS